MTLSASSCLEPPSSPKAPKPQSDAILPKSLDLQYFPDVVALFRGLTVLYPSRPLELVEVASVMSHGPHST